MLAIFIGLPFLVVLFMPIIVGVIEWIDSRRQVPTDPPDPPPSLSASKPVQTPNPGKPATPRRKKPAANKPTTVIAPPTANYSVVKSNIFLHHKRSLDVLLEAKLPKEDLINLAHYLKAQDPKKYDRTFILFYLPGMKIDAGAWASGHFNPNFELKHYGLSLEEERALRVQPSLRAGEERVGCWLEDSLGSLSGKTEFIKKGKSYEMRKTYSDGSIGTNRLSRRWTFGGYRYFKEGKTGPKDDYFKITKNNGLEIWSFDPLKGERILSNSLKPVVVNAPVPSVPATKKSTSKIEPPSPTRTSGNGASEPWYSGGTLHKAKMREWSRSSYPNRLATSSDFAAKMLEIDGKKIPPVDKLKPLAMLLEHNISTANSGGVANDQDVSAVAAACWILMNKDRK